MVEMKEAHILEISVDEEHKSQKQLCVISAIRHHPLTEISQSPGHLLLLKLWQREEDLFAKRISLKETRMESSRTQVFKLVSFFLLFHATFLTLLFTSSAKQDRSLVCHKWWVPGLLSASTSLVFVALVQIKLVRFWKVWSSLNRERNDNRALTRCVQELRMKGSSFDLSKEPISGKRMKSSSVEIKWKPITWCSRYLVTICLVSLAGFLFPASKLLLCVF